METLEHKVLSRFTTAGMALLTDSQEIKAALAGIGRADESGRWGCLLVGPSRDGELGRVLAMEGTIPYLAKPCFCLHPPHLADA